MASSNLQNKKSFKVKIKKKIGRLEKIITESIPKDLGISRTRVKNLISRGLIFSTISNRAIDLNHKLLEDETLILDLDLNSNQVLVKEKMKLDIIFEDEHLLVINKKPGLVVHPGSGINSGTLVNGLLYHCDRLSELGGNLRPGIVHRLDKDTSGLLVVAKSDQAYLGLRDQFSNHSAKRLYTALIWGSPNINYNYSKKNLAFCLEENKIYKISGKIGRHPVNRKKMAIRNDNNGKHATTRFKIKNYYKFKNKVAASLVECWLETGRTHQIRVHMDSINNGIVGDQTYRSGKKTDNELINALGSFYINFKRQALHARNLSFIHPITSENKSFETSLPLDFKKLKELFSNLN
ncbi:MAG: RluA family pseudouridine synthase [Paracoccaceae bacterium]